MVKEAETESLKAIIKDLKATVETSAASEEL
jgi:hypothetical protein